MSFGEKIGQFTLYLSKTPPTSIANARIIPNTMNFRGTFELGVGWSFVAFVFWLTIFLSKVEPFLSFDILECFSANSDQGQKIKNPLGTYETDKMTFIYNTFWCIMFNCRAFEFIKLYLQRR